MYQKGSPGMDDTTARTVAAIQSITSRFLQPPPRGRGRHRHKPDEGMPFEWLTRELEGPPSRRNDAAPAVPPLAEMVCAGPSKGVRNHKTKMLKLLDQCPRPDLPSIATPLGLTERTARRNLQLLFRTGMITRRDGRYEPTRAGMMWIAYASRHGNRKLMRRAQVGREIPVCLCCGRRI
jgi:hypothetical protein